MKVAFISTYPPDRGNMAEYGWYLSRALAQLPHVEHVHVIANRVEGSPEIEHPHPRLTVHRVWTMDSVPSLLALPGKVRRLGVDVAHFNTHIRCWGPSREASFAGAALIPLFKAFVSRVVITMHTIGDSAQQSLHKEIGPITRLGIRAANKLYLAADETIVMLQSMREQLEREYGAKNAVHIPHGSYGARVDTPPKAPMRVLTFGFWGAFKDADLMVNAVSTLRDKGHDVELVLGGGAHPYHPEIYQEMRARYASKTFVRFTGYVPEDQLTDLFTSARVVVLPYRNNSGASGVLNLARSYGRAVVISADQGLMEQIRDEGGASMVFSSQSSLVDGLEKVLTNEGLERKMAQANLDVARKLTIESLAGRIAETYEPEYRAQQALAPLTPVPVGLKLEVSQHWPPLAEKIA